MAPGIGRVGVVGLGVMGFEIAFLYAAKGYRTLAYDAAGEAVRALPERRERTIERLRARGRIVEGEIENARRLLEAAPALECLAAADLVTEAVSEKIEVKKSVYGRLSAAGFRGILTTNTSSLPRGLLLADRHYDSRRFVTTHFFNPVLHTRMVELVLGDASEETAAQALSFLRRLGRDPVETRDISGFVSNSLLMYYAVMALRLRECGYPIEAIDGAARELRLLPPFVSLDRWRPSIVEDVTRAMFEIRGDAFLRSSRSLAALARQNPRFYAGKDPSPEIDRYLPSGASSKRPQIEGALSLSLRIAAARLVELGEEPAKIDHIAVHGLKLPEPPLQALDRIGAEAALRDLEEVNSAFGDGRLDPPGILRAMAEEKQGFYLGEEPNPWLAARVRSWRSRAGD
jgi:3-hydroxyacyl-CoA dehydrogenase